MSSSIRDVAKVIRSKNAGPFELTFDILFKEARDFAEWRSREAIHPALIARLYKIPVEDVLGIIWFEPARAVKITIKRPMPSGAPGETDIYGAQQHAPLLEIKCSI